MVVWLKQDGYCGTWNVHATEHVWHLDHTAEALDQVRCAWSPAVHGCKCMAAFSSSDICSTNAHVACCVADMCCSRMQLFHLRFCNISAATPFAFVPRRLEAVERLILESQRRYPNNLEAGIDHAMREMEAIISDAEHGNAAAVAEVRQMPDA